MSTEVENISNERYQLILSGEDPEGMEQLLDGKLAYDEANAPVVDPVIEPEILDDTENKLDEESASSGADVVIEGEVLAEESPAAEPKVLAKDGKHFIDYSVLQNARARAQAAENEAAALRAKLDAQATEQKPAAEDPESLSEEELAEIAETDPTMAKAIKLLLKQNQKIAEVKTEVAPVKTQPTETVELSPEDVQSAIDSVPELALWQATNPRAFKLAGAIDAELSTDPAHSALPLKEQYAIVAERVQLALGKKTPAPTPTPTPKTDVISPAKIAEQKIAAAKSAVAPTSLTNLGVSPSTEKTFMERFAEMTPEEQQASMATMSDAEINKLLGA